MSQEFSFSMFTPFCLYCFKGRVTMIALQRERGDVCSKCDGTNRTTIPWTELFKKGRKVLKP